MSLLDKKTIKTILIALMSIAGTWTIWVTVNIYTLRANDKIMVSEYRSEIKRIEENTNLILGGFSDNVSIYQKNTIRAIGRLDRNISKLRDELRDKADK